MRETGGAKHGHGLEVCRYVIRLKDNCIESVKVIIDWYLSDATNQNKGCLHAPLLSWQHYPTLGLSINSLNIQ